MSLRFAILIPALNEALKIREVVVSALQHSAQVIVVDDGSNDGTSDCVNDLPITLIRHDSPQGKAASLLDGFRLAMDLPVDAVLTMDGDGQHLASDIPRMLAAAQCHPQTMVIAARLLHREQQPASRRRANAVADWGVSWASAHRVVDSQSGQRLYPRRVLQLALDMRHGGFVFESEILIEAFWQLGVRTVSVPIASRYPADARASHFRGVRDTTRITWMIIRKIIRRGLLIPEYLRMRREAPLILDLEPEAHAAKPGT
jgi:glycosyltransferase involved in cell wall biosynthesis